MVLEDLLQSELIQILMIILGAVILNMTGRSVIERVVRRAIRPERYEHKIDERKREDTVINFFRAAWLFILVLAAFFASLAILDVNVAALVTGAGLFGVIFGIGAQSTIKSYIAGINILAENQYRVGDVVSFSGGNVGTPGPSGVVEEVTLRVTKLRDMDGRLNIIANGDAGVITNMTYKYAGVVVDVTVGHDSNLAKVEEVINETGKAMLESDKWSKQIIEPVSFLRIENFTEVGITVRMLGKVQAGAQWDVGGEFRHRLKNAFDKAGIQLAIPQRIVHNESDVTPRRRSTDK